MHKCKNELMTHRLANIGNFTVLVGLDYPMDVDGGRLWFVGLAHGAPLHETGMRDLVGICWLSWIN